MRAFGMNDVKTNSLVQTITQQANTMHSLKTYQPDNC